jgi:Holliday junction resolvase RusA-like endonuclease
MKAIAFIVSEAPRTKKNHGYVVKAGGRRRHMPSKAWQSWVRSSVIEWNGRTLINADFRIDYPVNCKAIFYRDANRGDLVGYMQGLADLLEKKGVVVNDKYITSWDGSRLDKDKENPRTEVELEGEK